MVSPSGPDLQRVFDLLMLLSTYVEAFSSAGPTGGPVLRSFCGGPCRLGSLVYGGRVLLALGLFTIVVLGFSVVILSGMRLNL